MTNKKRFAFVGAHTGNVVNEIAPVARLLRQMGHGVAVYLQRGLSASQSYYAGGTVKESLGELDVYSRDRIYNTLRLDGSCDAVICAMSPVITGPNVENLEISWLRCGVTSRIPVFGVSDFPGSWRNPGWRDFSSGFTTLFAPMPEQNAPCPCVVSGWGALEKWRGVDVKAMGQEARRILEIDDDFPVLVVSFSPEQEAPLALNYLLQVMERIVVQECAIVLNRHGRERSAPIPGNGRRFRDALTDLGRMRCGHVFDNSPEYDDVEESDERAILDDFRPKQFLTYQQMLALTANGLYLSFFGTDALVAPYLAEHGVLSACWLDPVFGGAVLKREKQVETLDLPVIWEMRNDAELNACLYNGLALGQWRNKQLAELQDKYPFPKASAPQIIVDEILRQLG